MKVSVSLITYNHERFIERALASVLEQDLEDLEIVVSDDCSTDGTWDLLCRARDQNPKRVRLMRTRVNSGGGESFLQSVEQCRGEYVAFLEGDDFWSDPRKLSYQVQLLDREPGMSFCFHSTRSFPNGSDQGEFLVPRLAPVGRVDVEFLTQRSNPVALGSVLARRSALRDLRKWLTGLRLGDWALCFMLAGQGHIGFIAREMSRYRIHQGGGWSTLAPSVQVIFMLHMLLRVARLSTDDAARRIGPLVDELASWLGYELIVGEVPVDRVLDEARALGDLELDALVISHLLRSARRVAESRAWLEGQVASLSSAMTGWQEASEWHRSQAAAWEAEALRHDARARALQLAHANPEK